MLDTWFSSALWPFATLGWPERDARAARLLPDRRPLDGARHPVPLGRADGDAGPRVHGRHPVHDVYVHSVIQAPDGRRMSKSLGTGHRPARRDRPPRRRRGALRPARDVLDPGREVLQREGPAGPAAGEQAVQRLALRAAQRPGRRAPRRGRRRSTTAGSCRGCRRRRRRSPTASTASTSPSGALGLYDFVYGELCDWYLEFTKGREFDADLSATMLHVLRETLALAHPMIPFVTEELWGHVPGSEGLLATARIAAPDPSLRDEAAEAEIAAVDRGGAGAALVARRGRRQAGPGPARAHRRARRRRPTLVARHGAAGPRRRDGEPTATVRGPRRQRRDPRRRPRRPRGRGPQGGRRARARAAGDRPRGGQARERRASSPRRRRTSSQAERDKLERLRRELDGVVARMTYAGGGALPAVARAVRHALRPGPHAPADDRARLAAGALRLGPRRRARTASPRRCG